VRSVVEKVEVGHDLPPVLVFYFVTIPATSRIHPSSKGWTMDPSEARPIRRKNKLNVYGHVRTNMISLSCRLKIMHVKR